MAWLIDPKNRSVSIYSPGQPVQVLVNPERVTGKSPVDGFVLELAVIWRGL